ncbi:hypothetical protein [Streptomyces indicus]|uniref:Uncharacterized protein n=1 Tax=Streptomyces indicus TaxID=417292 RepID=A0A1G9JNF4_9ACTN|nr:hypothetical protein [Streptomyces indicus]SDL39127.1 hypothetical protein SAMN05421806_13326 [Streptomyces indicus]
MTVQYDYRHWSATSAGRASHGNPIAGTEITAALPATKQGPHFTDQHGRPTHTLALTPTGTAGRTLLPGLTAGNTPGTYRLTLTTTEGVTLDIELTVTPGHDHGADAPRGWTLIRTILG